MRRNCNLELRLHSADYNQGHHQPQPMFDWLRSGEGQKQQQLTIFYNGRVSVCDATELQAKAIIMLASREMEERVKSPSGSEPNTPSFQSQSYSSPTTPTTGLSMKRSLQRFLQKRKDRILSTSPYNH